MSIIVCKTRLLTPSQQATALRRGLEVNPANAADLATLSPGASAGRRGGQRRLAVVIARRWPQSGADLTVQFLDDPSEALRKRLLLHMNAWGLHANVRFAETRDVGMVRVARLNKPPDDAGFWSYIGTEILGIEDDQPTMNLEGFTMRTAESEFLRVVRHEAGHTLGFEHEHMRGDLVQRIDRRKAFAYYKRSDDWSQKETEEQVLTPLKARSLMGTAESDPLSIMCYQIPAEITKDGKEIAGGTDINEKDHAFAAKVYPKSARQTPAAVPAAERPPIAPIAQTPLPGSTAVADETMHIVVLDSFDAASGTASGQRGDATFARVFASYAGARVTQALRLKASGRGSSTRFRQIIDTHQRIKAYTNREQGTLPSDAEMIDFGDDLFETLFQGEVRRLYDEARSRQQGSKLDLVLTSMISWIAEKPWEFAYDRTRNSFLATEEVHFIRNALAAVPAERLVPRAGPLRILVAAAQPVGFGHLSIAQEEEVIRRGFDGLVAAGLAEVTTLPRATPSAIQSCLSTAVFDVVHFIGHGAFDEATGGSLVFEDGNGGSFQVGERSLREIFCGRGVSLVFLNACESGSGGQADFNKGVAQALVSHGLPALVANQYSVLDSSATSFAQHFYWALAQGMGIGQAAREARIAVNCSLQGELIDWAVPVVYARDPSMTLCLKPPTVAAAPAAASRAAGRRRARTDERQRIAVWDIDNVFPALEDTLRRMSEAQAVFSFELAHLSAPLDIWDVQNKAHDGTPYLVAESLARRMAGATVDLGVDLLACITRHWMRDESTLNLYGWWPVEHKPPVVVASFAGFEGLTVEGQATERAIANLMVSALAGFIGGIDAHVKGPKDCPMWHNPNRLLSHMTAPQRFDANCRNKLKKQHDSELDAFDALLKAFV